MGRGPRDSPEAGGLLAASGAEEAAVRTAVAGAGPRVSQGSVAARPSGAGQGQGMTPRPRPGGGHLWESADVTPMGTEALGNPQGARLRWTRGGIRYLLRPEQQAGRRGPRGLGCGRSARPGTAPTPGTRGTHAPVIGARTKSLRSPESGEPGRGDRPPDLAARPHPAPRTRARPNPHPHPNPAACQRRGRAAGRAGTSHLATGPRRSEPAPPRAVPRAVPGSRPGRAAPRRAATNPGPGVPAAPPLARDGPTRALAALRGSEGRSAPAGARRRRPIPAPSAAPRQPTGEPGRSPPHRAPGRAAPAGSCSSRRAGAAGGGRGPDYDSREAPRRRGLGGRQGARRGRAAEVRAADAPRVTRGHGGCGCTCGGARAAPRAPDSRGTDAQDAPSSAHDADDGLSPLPQAPPSPRLRTHRAPRAPRAPAACVSPTWRGGVAARPVAVETGLGARGGPGGRAPELRVPPALRPPRPSPQSHPSLAPESRGGGHACFFGRIHVPIGCARGSTSPDNSPTRMGMGMGWRWEPRGSRSQMRAALGAIA